MDTNDSGTKPEAQPVQLDLPFDHDQAITIDVEPLCGSRADIQPIITGICDLVEDVYWQVYGVVMVMAWSSVKDVENAVPKGDAALHGLKKICLEMQRLEGILFPATQPQTRGRKSCG